MALRSTAHELEEIARFCRERTKDYYRFDPLLHLRFDGDPVRNEEIRAERLSPEEVVAVERADEERFGALQKGCADGELIMPRGRALRLRPPLPLRRRQRQLHGGLRRHLPPLQLAVAPGHRLRPAHGHAARGLGGVGAARARPARHRPRVPREVPHAATSSTSASGARRTRRSRPAPWTTGWSTSARSRTRGRRRWATQAESRLLALGVVHTYNRDHSGGTSVTSPRGSRREWVRPQLTVLVRSRPEEMVLAGCKSLSTWRGPNSTNLACIIFCGDPACQNIGTS